MKRVARFFRVAWAWMVSVQEAWDNRFTGLTQEEKDYLSDNDYNLFI